MFPPFMMKCDAKVWRSTWDDCPTGSTRPDAFKVLSKLLTQAIIQRLAIGTAGQLLRPRLGVVMGTKRDRHRVSEIRHQQAPNLVAKSGAFSFQTFK